MAGDPDNHSVFEPAKEVGTIGDFRLFEPLHHPEKEFVMSYRLAGSAFAAAFLAIALPLAGSARADEKLPADQQSKVEELLKKEGFTKWDEIEMDDGMIEVDDAVDANGKQFDLKLDPKTLEIKDRKEEKAGKDKDED